MIAVNHFNPNGLQLCLIEYESFKILTRKNFFFRRAGHNVWPSAFNALGSTRLQHNVSPGFFVQITFQDDSFTFDFRINFRFVSICFSFKLISFPLVINCSRFTFAFAFVSMFVFTVHHFSVECRTLDMDGQNEQYGHDCWKHTINHNRPSI